MRALLLVRRLGDEWPGIQHVSEWPNSLHSRVHVPVMATSGKGRRSAEESNTVFRNGSPQKVLFPSLPLASAS